MVSRHLLTMIIMNLQLSQNFKISTF